MNICLSERLRKTYWINWLNESVEYGDEWFQRQEVITFFVEKDLVPFLKLHGYRIHCPPKGLAQIIARELFHYLCNSVKTYKWHSIVLNLDYIREDQEHFYYVLDSYVWQTFWKAVPLWCDIDYDDMRVRSIIEHACWTCIHIENSPASDDVNAMFDTDDDDSITSKKEKIRRNKGEKDPYLVDQSHQEY